ncbi:MAG: ubiquinone/menaquinone biosynthesis methyltransferase [Victivallaceae bacterium]
MKTSPNTEILFNKIAKKYDLVNNVLSFGLHHIWNAQLLKLLKPKGILLDLCSGTGKIAFKFLKQNPKNRAILVDFSEEMLNQAFLKGKSFSSRISLIKQDVHDLPFPDSSFSFISLAYGFRNLSNPDIFLRETHRILKPGGQFGILELTNPKKWRCLHSRYLKTGTKIMGYLTGQKEAYTHLKDSIHKFPEEQVISSLLKANEFHLITHRTFLYGTATVWISEKINAS